MKVQRLKVGFLLRENT